MCAGLVLFSIIVLVSPSPAFLTDDRVVARIGSRLQLNCPDTLRQPHQPPLPLTLFVTWQCTECHGTGDTTTTTLARFDRDRAVRVLAHRTRVSLDRHSFRLTIDPLTAEDSGHYQCVVNNRPGPASIHVTAQDVPGPPGRPLVTGFTSRSVNISWAPSSQSRGSPIHHYIVQIKEGESGAWGGARATMPTDNNSTSFAVSGLKPYTVYSFRVQAVNELGAGAPSSASYFMVTHRELPAVRPVIVSTRNMTAHSVEVAWLASPQDGMNGEFIGYHLAFRPLTHRRTTTPTPSPPIPPSATATATATATAIATSGEQEEWFIVELASANVTKHVISGLDSYTRYRIRLHYANMEGLGPPVDVDILTAQGEPGIPRELSASVRGDTWTQLRWLAPDPAGAAIVGYSLHYQTEGHSEPVTGVKLVNTSGHVITYNLTGLVPFSEYRVWTMAKSEHSQSPPSAAISFRTDVSGPSAPLVENVTCLDDRSIFLRWQRPLHVRGALDFYLVEYRDEAQQLEQLGAEKAPFRQLLLPSSIGRQQESTVIANLTLDTVYEVRVSAGANSLHNTSRVYLGASSTARRLLLQPGCQQLQQLVNRQQDGRLLLVAAAGGPWSFTPGVAAGLACSVAAILLAALAYIMWKKYFQEAYNHLEEQNKTPSVLSTDWESESLSGHAAPLPVHVFHNHVYQLSMDGGAGYDKEFEAIQRQALAEAYPSDFSQQPENKTKNRYLNIIAYDHTRVSLNLLPGQKRCEYVNANYVDGYQRPRAYIGTQGPLPDTYATFWRMIWEQDVKIIVMITNLVERGRKKCDLYWPQEGSETYGLVTVTSAGEDVMATYTIRKFQLQYVKTKSRKSQQKTVYQYHYTHWPDHGIPETPLPLLSFVKKSSAANRDTNAPIVVHCSAGVGRTGTYIVLDSMIQMIRCRGELNIFGFLKHIRSQRNFLVQTQDQYVFIHEALLQAIECGETDIHCSMLGRYLHSLQTTDQDIYPWYNLERQFKLVTCERPTEHSVSSAHHPLNYRKNRLPELVPPDLHRVCLTPRPGTDGSDYINASWMMGFRRQQEFIVTQHPLVSTVHAFWQMIWDHNVQTIVLLSPVNDQEYCIFWPLEHQDIRLEQFSVRFTGETLQGAHMIREFIVHSTTDDYEMAVRIVQCSGWPTETSTLSGVFALVRTVQQWQSAYQQGPCVVVDRFGGAEAATFCCLTSLLQQLQYEAHVDVFMYARAAHRQRPGVWRTQDDFLLLYRAIDALISGSALAGDSPAVPVTVPVRAPLASHTDTAASAGPLQPKRLPPLIPTLSAGSYHLSAAVPVSTPLKPILKNSTAPSPACSSLDSVIRGGFSGSGTMLLPPPGLTAPGGSGGVSHVGRVPPDGRESGTQHLDNYANT